MFTMSWCEYHRNEQYPTPSDNAFEFADKVCMLYEEMMTNNDNVESSLQLLFF